MTDRHDTLTLVGATNPIREVEQIDPDELRRAELHFETQWEAERATGTLPDSRPYRPRRLRPALVMLVLAFVATLAIAIPLAVLRTTEQPTATQAPTTVEMPPTTAEAQSTTVPSVTTTAPTTIPLPPMPRLEIEQGITTASTEGVWINRIIPGRAGGPAWVAVGTRETVIVDDGDWGVELDGMVWVSDDGLGWRPVGELYGDMVDVVAGADRYVAVNFDGFAWHSPDGLEWTGIADEPLGGPKYQEMGALTYGPAGYVAVGNDGINAGAWFSTDGIAWGPVGEAVFDTGTTPSSLDNVVYGAGTYIARGQVGFSDTYSAVERDVLWTSVDGVTWEELPIESFGLTQDDDYNFEALYAGGPEVLVSVIADGSETIWRSRDGHTWEPWPRAFASGSYADSSSDRPDHNATIWDGTRWLYVGVDWDTGGIWITHDLAVPWQEVATLPLGRDGNIPMAATLDAIVLANNPGNPIDRPSFMVFWLATWDE